MRKSNIRSLDIYFAATCFFVGCLAAAAIIIGVWVHRLSAKEAAPAEASTALVVALTTETETETETEAETETEKKATIEEANSYFLRSLGEYRITVYTPYSDDGRWGYSTASGEKSRHLKTCAVDPSVLPLGSVIVVNGLTITATDTGSAVKGKTIDIFFDGTEAEAREWLDDFGETAEVRLQYWGDYSEDHAPVF